MIDLGRVSVETKGWIVPTFFLDNPCDPNSGYSQYAVVCR